MNFSQSRTALVVGLGWAATAAIAFCIGRIGLQPGTSGSSEDAVRGAVRAGGSARGSDAVLSAGAGGKGQFAMGESKICRLATTTCWTGWAAAAWARSTRLGIAA